MSANSDRIIAMLDACDTKETLAVAGAALDCLMPEQQIELILATLDADGQAELAEHLDESAHLDDGGAPSGSIESFLGKLDFNETVACATQALEHLNAADACKAILAALGDDDLDELAGRIRYRLDAKGDAV